MVRSFQIADLFTLANGCCGVAAVFHAMRFLARPDTGHLALGFAWLVAAAVFDVLDGRIARSRHQASALGREMDSLADVISFGVAPATMAFAAGLDTVLDQAILTYFTVCGLSRLARYNVTAEELSAGTGTVSHFEGTPIPTSLAFLAAVLIAWGQGWLLPVTVLGLDFHLVTLLFAVSGSLMISRTLRIPKL